VPQTVSTFQRPSTDELAWLGTGPVPAMPYYDPDYFELERQAVFLKSWIHVGHVCELADPGSFVRRDLEFARASLLIVRGRDERVRAFHNVCTHRGTRLVDAAAGRQTKFSCPYHMWTFGADGALLSAPDFESFHVDRKDCALREVALQECGGMLFVNFDPEAVPLREWLGEYAERLEQMPVARATTFSEYSYEIAANWKLTYDNFQENYHLRFIHSRTAGAGCGKDNPFGYPSHFSLNGKHRTQTIWTDPDPEVKPTMLEGFMRGAPRLAADGILENPFAREYFALLPNLFIFGSPGSHFLHTVFPLGPEKSRGVIRLYWIGEDETASVRYAREFSMAMIRDIHSEDVAVVQAGQRGVSSGALEHLHFQEKEILCRHLVKVVEEMVEAYRAETAQD
jgi:phenylpropionate dioxygenase-like ring-hydroxylating dioxygenase large terminal subunit